MLATVDFFLDVLVAVPFPLTVVSVHIERGMHWVLLFYSNTDTNIYNFIFIASSPLDAFFFLVFSYLFLLSIAQLPHPMSRLVHRRMVSPFACHHSCICGAYQPREWQSGPWDAVAVVSDVVFLESMYIDVPWMSQNRCVCCAAFSDITTYTIHPYRGWAQIQTKGQMTYIIKF